MAKTVKKKVVEKKKVIRAKQGSRKVGQKSLDALVPTQWKPGQSGNPAGPPKTRLHLWRYIGQYMAMSLSELKAINKDKLSMSQRAALTTAIKTAEGDWARVSAFIDRDEGKVPDVVINPSEQMTPEQAQEILDRVRQGE